MAYKKAVAAVARASEGIARRLGVAGLDAAGALVGAEQTIGGLKVDDLGLAVGARDGDLGRLLRHDGAERLVSHGVGAHEGDIAAQLYISLS